MEGSVDVVLKEAPVQESDEGFPSEVVSFATGQIVNHGDVRCGVRLQRARCRGEVGGVLVDPGAGEHCDAD